MGAQPAGPQAARPRVGVALGGGSARGLAHVGVLRWLEEHHIPVDVLAGTSMGGLIGGSYATGMTPDEIEAMLGAIDWDAMFGTSGFQFANVRRKRDRRSYPSHLEFGLKKGLAPPSSLNNGQQVDLLLSRITAPYYGIATFDELPTPFRCLAVDLKTARSVVLDRGSLAIAMRATMSLPLIFPAVELADGLLVDGGAMNNVPADVVRAMGADRTIAVNVGDLTDKETVNSSLFGLAGATLDAMMRANTLKALSGADVVINVPVTDFGSLDWRRYEDLIRAGYAAAEAMKAELLPLSVDEAAWQAWVAKRQAARRQSLPTLRFVEVSGAASADVDYIRRAMAIHVGKPLDPTAVAASLTELSGLDRYESLRWEVLTRNGEDGVLVTAHPKAYAPPFLFLGFSLENTTSNEFRFGMSGRYLAYDAIFSGSELRLDAAVGSDPSAAVALYYPLFTTRLFVEGFAGIGSTTFNIIQDGRVAAAYRQTRSFVGIDAGINVSHLDEVRAGVRFGRMDASVRIGDPGLPEVGGREATFRMQWVRDGQDSPVVPSHGIRVVSTLQHFLDSPPLTTIDTMRKTEGVTQFDTLAILVLVEEASAGAACVSRRRVRHVVRRPPAADRAVLHRRALAARRFRRRRAARRSVFPGNRGISATARASAGLRRRSALRRSVAGDRFGFRRVVQHRHGGAREHRHNRRYLDRAGVHGRQLRVRWCDARLHRHRADLLTIDGERDVRRSSSDAAERFSQPRLLVV